MPYKLHSLITFRGQLGDPSGPLESWTCGIRVGDPIAPHAGHASQVHVDAIHDHFSFMFANFSMAFSDSVTFTETRMYDIGVDNRATTAPFIHLEEATVGTASTPRHPFQCSLVCTFVAGGLGKGRRGRIFLPPQCLPIQRDGRILDAAADTMVFLLGQLLDNINIDMGGDAVCVISSGAGAGSLKPIDQVRLGHVLDTHRSRRRSLVEDYLDSTAAVA